MTADFTDKMITQINTTNMKRVTTASGIIVLVSFFIASCGGKDKKGEVGDMKVKLEKLKKEKNSLDAEIRKLEEQIAKADPKAAQQSLKLVTVDSVRIDTFQHYIELQGKIDAEGMAYVAPKGQGGLVKAIYVKPGQKVGKGQLILKLDDAMARQGVIAAQQQTGQLKARLAQAQTVYERYQSLWKQNIGAEIQVINAKADVDALAAQLRAAEAQVAMAQEQANMSNVYAEIGGVIDAVDVKVGEFFSPQSAAMPGKGIRIVNNNNLKIVANVPESYVGKVKNNASILVQIREPDTIFKATINAVGASIDPVTRSFTAEAKLKPNAVLKPNQIATMKILDKEVLNAFIVPVNVVQSDEKSKYVYIAEATGDKTVARKKTVTVGDAYHGEILILDGLKAGDMIITQGFQSVYDGQTINTGKK